MSLLAELKRRKVFRVGAAYLVLAWLGVQVASIALPTFEAPLWVLRVLILVLALGFPIAVVMAWLLEATPDGLKVEPAGVGNKRVIGAAAAVAALAIAWYFVGQPAVRDGGGAASTAAKPAMPTAPTVAERSIAVLAFADMSADGKHEYLGDGIAEEILNALAKVEGLKVAGRTSSFHYKGRNDDLRKVGRELGVAHVLEGSVRRQGEQVRITAQLIRAADGFHLWSETYPGTMDDVFALQDRIAHSVADQLKLVLSGAQSAKLVDAGTTNAEAYALYLQASMIFNRRQGERFPEGMAALQRAIALDPRYARAWARLASMHAISGNYRTLDSAQVLKEVEAAARHASDLDPTLGEPHAAMALAWNAQRRFKEGRAAFDRALQRQPGDITANVWHGVTLAQSGYRRAGNVSLDRALAIDPMLPIALLWRGMSHASDGELELAQQKLRLAEESNLAFVGLGRSQLASLRGDAAEAAVQIARGFRVLSPDFAPAEIDVFARACSGDAAARPAAMALVDRYLGEKHAPTAAVVPYVMFCSGEFERGLELFARGPTSNDALVNGALFRGAWPEVFAVATFPAAARRIGWAELWDEYGPPDMCRKTGQDWRCAAPVRAAR